MTCTTQPDCNTSATAEFGDDPNVQHASIMSRRAFVRSTLAIAASSRFRVNGAQGSATKHRNP
jgi:hypothetical protein